MSANRRLRPRELHLYIDEDTDTATFVAVYDVTRTTQLTGSARYTYQHDHRDGGAAPSSDDIHIGIEFRDATTPPPTPAAAVPQIRPPAPTPGETP